MLQPPPPFLKNSPAERRTSYAAEQKLDYIDEWIASRRVGQIITPNCDQIVQVEKNPALGTIWNDAELLFADGHPLLWFAKWYKTPLKEKINGSSFVPELCARAAEKGYSVFLLGAGPGVADQAAENLKKAYPGIQIAGTYSPSYILILGVGVPKQEIFGYQNQEKYNIPVTINAGATIDFLAGNKKRAPKWMVDSGLEWLYRTIKEPKRVGGRVLRDLAIFPLAWKYRPRK